MRIGGEAPTKGGKAAAFHVRTLPIGQIGIEQFQRGAVRPHVDGAEEDPSKFEKWRQAGFTLVPLTAPRRYDHNHRHAIGAGHKSKLCGQLYGRRTRAESDSAEN